MNFNLNLSDNQSKIRSALSRSQDYRIPTLKSVIKKQNLRLPKPPQFFQSVEQIDTQSIADSFTSKDEQTKPSYINTSRLNLSSTLNQSVILFKKKNPQKKLNFSVRLDGDFQSQKQLQMKEKVQKLTSIRQISSKTNINQKLLHKYYKKLLTNKLFLLSLQTKIVNKTQIEEKYIIEDMIIKKLKKNIQFQQNNTVIQQYEDRITSYLQDKLRKIINQRGVRGQH